MIPARTCAICAGGELAALDLLLEELHRLADARLERLRGDVLHQDRHAPRRRLVGDPAAHDPGAEDGGALHGPGRLRVLLRDLLHAPGRRGRRSTSAWAVARLRDLRERRPPRSPAPRRGSCPRPSRSPRWRRPGRGSAGRPCRPRTPSTPTKTIPASIALSLSGAFFSSRRAFQSSLPSAASFSMREGRVAQVGRAPRPRPPRPTFSASGRRPLLAAGDPLDRGVGPAEAREPDGPAPAGEEAELRLGQADLRRRATSRGSSRRGTARSRRPRATPLMATTDGASRSSIAEKTASVSRSQPGELLLALLEVREELGDVGADAEDVLAARDEDAAQALRGARSSATAVFSSPTVERVELVDRLALQVEPQLDEAVVEGKDLHGLSFVAHGLLLREGVARITRPF